MRKFITGVLHSAQHDRYCRRLLFGSLGLIGLHFANVLLLQLLGLPQRAWPWSFLQVLYYGFIPQTVIAFSVAYTPIVAGCLWLEGGVKRVIGRNTLLAWLSFIGASWLGLYIFTVWEGVNIPLHPWLIGALMRQLPVNGEAYAHLWLSLIGSYALLIVAVALKLFSRISKAEKVFGKAHFSTAFEIQRAGLFGDQGIVIGKAHGKLLRVSGFEGALVVAPTGGGKTTSISVPNLLEWSGSGVFNDLKGELYRLTAKHRREVLGNTCYQWAPADTKKQSARYNPFFYVSDNPDLRMRDIQLIAEALIPAAKHLDGFWHQSSRGIFLALSLYLFETKGMATLADIYDLSKQERFFSWLMAEMKTNKAVFPTELIQEMNSVFTGSEDARQNTLKDFQSRIGLFGDPLVRYATSGNDFDLSELRRQKISLYLHIPDSDKDRLSPILTLFWSQLINAMSDHEPSVDEPYGVLALMDEFGNMARINKLKEGMSFLRSYHVRCIVIVQYLAQITSLYGRDDDRGFLNSKVKIAFALNDMEDAVFFSKALGQKTVKVSSTSINTGHGDNPGTRSENISYQSRALMTPNEVMQLSDKKEIILLEARSPILANKCYWFKEATYHDFLKDS